MANISRRFELIYVHFIIIIARDTARFRVLRELFIRYI